ncbi:hypothetical protein AVEN_274154-1 [Araneus ventricosus]|uniref:Uncharacterized protein n=1 Tax=Araneus ventricosus TaxID=182803 RepID=A0A4Y2G051_ARAVE|nr:hypothetical protein AVEN_274154-1 [Araneus ventricosus]
MGNEQTHLEPLIIACQSLIEGMCASLETLWNTPWFAFSTIQVRRRFTGNEELHSNTSQRELRIPFSPKNRQDLVPVERIVRSFGLQVHTRLKKCRKSIIQTIGI